MTDIIISLIPVFIFFGLGILLRKVHFTTAEHGAFLLKFVTFVSLPSLILATISKVNFSVEKIYLPFIGVVVILGCMTSALLFFRWVRISDQTKGSILISSMIINDVYMFPFIFARFGESALADAVLFDFGNAIMTSTVTYVMAFRYNGEKQRSESVSGKLFKSTLFWAVILALMINLLSVHLPALIRNFLESMGNLTGPLTLLGLGIVFSPKLKHLRLIVPTLFIRMCIGMCIGAFLAYVLGLDGVTFIVVTLCSGAPIGFVSASFASVAKLDVELTSSVISASVIVSIILIPFIMYLYKILA